jgi:hypothetical protein
MWTAVGTFLDEPLDLQWDNGPKDWPDWIKGMIDEDITSAASVPLTVTGPVVPLSWSDPSSILAYLDQIGDIIAVKGDRPPPAPESLSKRPPGGTPTIY